MKSVIVYNRDQQQILGRVRIADGYGSRLQGLLFCDPKPSGEGLWLSPCNAIHRFGMRHSIDAVFLDRQLRVVRIAVNLKPWGLGPVFRKACSVLEFFSGTWEKSSLHLGDQLELGPEVLLPPSHGASGSEPSPMLK